MTAGRAVATARCALRQLLANTLGCWNNRCQQPGLRASLRAASARTVLLALPLLPGALLAAPAASQCPPLPQASGAPAADRGVLWELHKDGRRSWLFGTLHVGRPDWARPGPQLAAALASSDVLALELDPAQALPPAAAASQPAAAALPAALRTRLAAAADRACLPPDALAGLPPVLQATVLSLLDARWLGLDPSYAQEHLLAMLARQRGLPVVALETVALQTSALQDGSPEHMQALITQTLDQIEDRRSRAVMARLAGAWEAGDLPTLESFERWCDCAPTESDRAFLQRLNDGRNPALAEGIAARHASGQRVFAAVGALHMTGPASLPLLLAQRGFEVRRVPLPRPTGAAPAAAAGR
jgi:uncharacterized protein YbaP (TraB family)